ncbi:TNF receptor-associated factor 3-like isoform X2 [Dysidea avara]|uniref:TNF receptor-associated factor 3-like isoform X2 n=1 Tax=Dysidea avara TaxID=196820 RepID=UPI00332B24D2
MPGYVVHLQSGEEVRDGLRCSHCHLVLKDPVQTTSGLIFCRDCFKETLCNLSAELEPNNEEVISVKEEIDRLQVKCPHYITGCDWRGVFKDCLVVNKLTRW